MSGSMSGPDERVENASERDSRSWFFRPRAPPSRGGQKKGRSPPASLGKGRRRQRKAVRATPDPCRSPTPSSSSPASSHSPITAGGWSWRLAVQSVRSDCRQRFDDQARSPSGTELPKGDGDRRRRPDRRRSPRRWEENLQLVRRAVRHQTSRPSMTSADTPPPDSSATPENCIRTSVSRLGSPEPQACEADAAGVVIAARADARGLDVAQRGENLPRPSLTSGSRIPRCRPACSAPRCRCRRRCPRRSA